MYQANYDTNPELCITRYGNGIQLTPKRQKICSLLPTTVSDVMSLPCATYFLDVDSVIRDANSVVASTLNFNSVNDTIGKTVKDTLINDAAISIIQDDLYVMKTGKNIVVEHHAKRCDDLVLNSLAYKFPWYNKDGKIIGIFGFSVMLDNSPLTSIADSLSLVMNTGLMGCKKLPLVSVTNHIQLTKRESDIARLLVFGRTAKQIASQLSLSIRTVENYTASVKSKFNVSDKSELIEKLIDIYI